LEINKKIAEIKKLKNEIWIQVADSNYVQYQNSADMYNWAEDIADAWELVEEMTREGVIKPDSHFNIVKDPMTICITYLHWKNAI